VSLTTIDWLGYRTQDTPWTCIEALRAVFGSDGPLLKATPKKHGKQGYERSMVLSLDDFVLGDMSFGGDAMRGWVWVEIGGKGCQWVPDWNRCEDELSALSQFQYKRVDIALDTFKREVTHDKVVQAHRNGLFTTCGKPPSMTKIEPENPYEGCTAYVGKRPQPKFLRGYQKGYELARQYPGIVLEEINGFPIDDIYRLELELKPVHQKLPSDLIENRDQYFAGAYPYLQTVLDVKPEIFKQSRDKSAQRSLASMLGVLRAQYGNTLFTALTAYNGDVGAVWDRIVGAAHNDKLLTDGVLLVDHE